MVIDSCRIHKAKHILEDVHQEHVLTFFEQLNEAGKDKLLSQIERINWKQLESLIESHVKNIPSGVDAENVDPAPWYPNKPTDDLKEKYQKAQSLGEKLISAGKVAAFTVAGGQGTRLGWDGPKGTFPTTPIRSLPLFGVFAEYVQNISRRYKSTIPWYIMTSDVNDSDTRQFFTENDYFGLGKENIFIFTQNMLPAMDLKTGKVLLEAPDSIALAPNGHGGTLESMYSSGALEDMRSRGVEQISYFQVDNPSVHCIDPRFIGLHVLDEAQMSSKMLAKREPKEKLGNFCVSGGKLIVIEYSDLPDELAFEKNEDGSLKFSAGSIAIHVLRRDFVEYLNSAGTKEGWFKLPFHRAEKKVPYVDLDSGKLIKPEEKNGVKLETFVFDALKFCDNSIILQTDRVEEFAPIKNGDSPQGEPMEKDSPASSKQLQIERAARWLEAAGVKVDRNKRGEVEAVIEISHKSAIKADDLKNLNMPKEIKKGDEVLL